MTKKYKSLCISGGGTKITGLFGALESLMKVYSPEILVGTSAGAILAFLIPMIHWKAEDDWYLDICRDKFLNLKKKSIWSKPPLTEESNKLTFWAIWRIITGKSSLGVMDNLERLLRDFVPERAFNFYKKQGIYKKIFIGVVDIRTGSRHYVDILSVEYEDAIKYVMASSSIPVFSEGSGTLYDGGLRDHVGAAWLFKEWGPLLTENITLYSRPQDYKLNELKGSYNIYNILTRSIDIMTTEISKSDEFEEISLADQMSIKSTRIYLPSILTSTYDTNKERLYALYKAGKHEGKRYK